MKKKNLLFGKNIAPDCSYCIYAVGEEKECTLHLFIDIDGTCTRFAYDPLLRKPRNEPKLKSDYKMEDFQL